MKRTINYKLESDYNSINAFLKDKNYPKAAFVYLRNTENTALINGIAEKLYKPLKKGDILTIIINEEKTSDIEAVKPDFDIKSIIIYEDEDILIVNKPSQMSIHPSINHYNDTLANYICHYYTSQGVDFVFRCINRLDKNTSGLTIIAKNILSSALLQRQVKEKTLQRTYLAICEGHIKEKGTIDAPIGRINDSIITRQVDYENGKSAITHFKRIKEKDSYSLIELQLETGRTHQIRVHLKHINHPIIGDDLYNPNYKDIERHALHSYKLDFIHPITNKKMSITAPLPKDMASIIDI